MINYSRNPTSINRHHFVCLRLSINMLKTENHAAVVYCSTCNIVAVACSCRCETFESDAVFTQHLFLASLLLSAIDSLCSAVNPVVII